MLPEPIWRGGEVISVRAQFVTMREVEGSGTEGPGVGVCEHPRRVGSPPLSDDYGRRTGSGGCGTRGSLLPASGSRIKSGKTVWGTPVYGGTG